MAEPARKAGMFCWGDRDVQTDRCACRPRGRASAALRRRQAQALPDLGGKTVVVVTENAYPPLQFVDPKTGKQIGWEYDAMDEIAKRLNFKVEYQNTSWDAMIQAVSDKQYNIGMTGITIKDDRKEKVDFSDPYMRSEISSCWCAVTKAASRMPKAFAATSRTAGRRAGRHDALLHRRLQRARRQRDRTRASSCSRHSAPRSQALKSGDVDVVLTDSTAGKGYVDASGGKLKLVGDPLAGGGFRLHLHRRAPTSSRRSTPPSRR